MNVAVLEVALEEYLDLAASRLKSAGLMVLGFADDLFCPTAYPPLMCLGRKKPEHICEVETLVRVPCFVVLPVEVERIDGRRVCRPTDSITPYVALGFVMTHFEWQKPTGNFRPATLLECVCAMAFHPQYGSFRTKPADENWSVEACFWGRGRDIKLHSSPHIMWGQEHHKLWAPIDKVPVCSSTRDLVCIS